MVVGVVGRGHQAAAFFERRPREQRVARVAGRVLYAGTLLFGEAFNVGGKDGGPYAVFGAQLFYEGGVGVGQPAPEFMVDMADVQLQPVRARLPGEVIQQHHGIRPARDGQQDGVPVLEQLPAPRVGVHAVPEIERHGLYGGHNEIIAKRRAAGFYREFTFPSPRPRGAICIIPI